MGPELPGKYDSPTTWPVGTIARPMLRIATKGSEIDEAGAIVAERMGVLPGHVRKPRHAAGRIDAIRLARRSAECTEVRDHSVCGQVPIGVSRSPRVDASDEVASRVDAVRAADRCAQQRIQIGHGPRAESRRMQLRNPQPVRRAHDLTRVVQCIRGALRAASERSEVGDRAVGKENACRCAGPVPSVSPHPATWPAALIAAPYVVNPPREPSGTATYAGAAETVAGTHSASASPSAVTRVMAPLQRTAMTL